MADNRLFSSIHIVSENRPAQHDRCVYFSVDRGFYPFALFVATQIAEKNPKRDFDICILSQDDLEPHELWTTHGFRILKIDTGDLAAKVPSDARISFAAYLRIMAPTLLENDYRRMLYLDADFFYQRGDLSRLLDLDLLGHPVGAVRDMIQLRKKHRVPNDFEALGLGFAPYFNSGFLLIDTAAWAQADLGEVALRYAAENADKIMKHDQTVLNVVLMHNWAELPLIWNYEYSHQTMYFAAMFDVCFFHFVGRRKPFKGGYGGFGRRFTRDYQRFFATYFAGQHIEIQDGLQIDKQWHKHVFVLMFHILNVKRFLWNDDRFESDWDVQSTSLSR